MTTPDAISVRLGDLEERAMARVKSGAYASMDDVLRAGLRALDREDAVIDAALRRGLREALDDPMSMLQADQVFAELRAHHAERVELAGRGGERDA